MKKIAKVCLSLVLVLAMSLAAFSVLAEEQSAAPAEKTAAAQETKTAETEKEKPTETEKAEPTKLAEPDHATGDVAAAPQSTVEPEKTLEPDSTITPESTTEPVETAEPESTPTSESTAASEQQPDVTPEAAIEDVQDEQPEITSFDMTQFVPNKDYGLFYVNGGGGASKLDGRTLTLGESYTLRASFRVKAAVMAGQVYTYELPKFLMGESKADEASVTHKGKTVATFRAVNNELRVVFSDYAAEKLAKGRTTFELKYDFRETLDASVVGSADQVTFKMPTATGRLKSFTVSIEGNEPEVVESEVEETVDPAEVPTEEQITEEQPTEELAGEAEQQPEESAPQDEAQREILVERDMPSIIRQGQSFQVRATLVGFEGIEYTLQWQYDAGEGWVDYAADTLAIDVVSDGNNINYNWRVLALIQMPVEEAAPITDAAPIVDEAPTAENAA